MPLRLHNLSYENDALCLSAPLTLECECPWGLCRFKGRERAKPWLFPFLTSPDSPQALQRGSWLSQSRKESLGDVGAQRRGGWKVLETHLLLRTKGQSVPEGRVGESQPAGVFSVSNSWVCLLSLLLPPGEPLPGWMWEWVNGHNFRWCLGGPQIHLAWILNFSFCCLFPLSPTSSHQHYLKLFYGFIQEFYRIQGLWNLVQVPI